MEMCLQYLDLDEYVIYEKWLEIEKDMFKLQEYLCIENAKVCR